MSKIFLSLFIIFSLPVLAQSKEDKLWQKVDLLHKAVFETKDSVLIKSLVGEKLSYGHSAGNIERKAEMITKAATSPIVYKNLSTERLSIDFVKKMAIVRLILRATSVDRGVESPLNLGMLQVWSKEGKDWKLQARQAVRVNPK